MFRLFKGMVFLFILILLENPSPPLWAGSLPDPPTQLTAAVGAFNIFLSWKSSPSPSVVGYNIYRREPGADGYSLVNPEPIPGPKYTIPSDNYFCFPVTFNFVVKAVAGSRPLLESRETNIATLLIDKDPRVFKKSPIATKGQGFIDIAQMENMAGWPDPGKHRLEGYNVYMSDGGEIFGLANPKPLGNVPTFLIRNLEPGKTYFFAFKAVMQSPDDHESDPSKTVKGIAKPYGPAEGSSPAPAKTTNR